MTKEFFERGKQIAKWADANMTKDTSLKRAIKEMTDAIPHLDIHFDDYFEAIQACKEALEQPSWQGLSDDEIWNIANFLGKNKEWDYPVMFAKTIEQALKEKNNA